MGGSREYWNRRYLMDKARIINNVEDFLKENQKELYTQAGREVQEKIEEFYKRYAREENLSLADAREKLSRADLKKIDWEWFTSFDSAEDLPEEIQKLMTEKHMSYQQMVNTMSKKGSITRLQMLQAEIDKTVLDLYDQNQHNIYEYLTDEYENVYYRGIYNTQQRLGYGYDFVAPNRTAINTAILNQYQRQNFSGILYKHCDNLSKDLRQCLTVGMITGENLDKMARRVRKRLDVSYSNAKRLVRTETAYVYEQATKQGYEDCGVEKYRYMATLDRKTSKLCRPLDGKVVDVKAAMPGKNFPPMHPNCRCTTVCEFPEDKEKRKNTTRLAKGENGKYYEVPADMTYKQWAKKHMVSYTNAERKALNDYMGFRSYIINEKLRTGAKLNAQEKMMVRKLDSCLSKMPKYQGNLVRDLEFRNQEQRKTFLTAHQAGELVHYKSYTSTSLQEGYNEHFDVRIYIENASSGRDIRSFNKQENEILYERGARFMVKEVVEADDTIYVLMEEYHGKG